MNETLTIRLDERLADALQKEAEQSGVSKGEIARQAIQTRLWRSGALRVINQHFGVMRGPADLSTNKTYRRAWAKGRR